jgi:hypothetical protein
MRALVSSLAFVLLLFAMAAPASARLWKPTPQQQVADYLSITHNKSDGRVDIVWLAAPMVAITAKPIIDKYVVITIGRIRRGPDGAVIWDDVQGVQVSDGAGNALKEVSADQMPPLLIGMIATAEAAARQNSQGKSKVFWGVYEAGTVNACQRGKLNIVFEGETYSFDTPVPGCDSPAPKP